MLHAAGWQAMKGLATVNCPKQGERVMSQPQSDRRNLMKLLVGAGGLAAVAQSASAGGDEGPCPELLGHPVRVIGPDSAVTMDYNPNRVNIYHDENYIITQIAFG
jgi:hypothetical protein